MAALTNKIGNDPVLFPLLNIFYLQGRQFGAPQTAAQENGERGVVSLAAETVNVYSPQKTLTLHDPPRWSAGRQTEGKYERACSS